MNYPTEWYINDKIQNAIRDLARSDEVYALRSEVGRLESSLREARAETDGLRNEIQGCKDQVAQLVSIVDSLAHVAAL